MRPVPVGRAGRAVHRRRAGWAAATWAGPELTAERFVPDPFAARAGRAAVPDGRPGRAAVPDGSIEYLGRARPPGEDARLPHRARARSRPRSLAAPGRAGGRGGRARGRARRQAPRGLRASASADATRELRAFLEARAARVHGALGVRRPLDALPLSPTARWTAGAAGARARSATERRRWRRARPPRRRSRRIWARVLGVDGVGAHDRLLRARRPLAAGDAGGGAAPRGRSAWSCRCARSSRRRR